MTEPPSDRAERQRASPAAFATLETMLGAVRRRLFRHRATTNLFWLVASVLLGGWVAASVEAVGYLPSGGRWALLASLVCLGGVALWRGLIRALRRAPSLVEIALRAQARDPSLRERISTALTLCPRREEPDLGCSPQLVEVVVEQAAEQVGRVDFAPEFPRHQLVRAGRALAVAVGLWLLSVAAAPEAFRGALVRLAAPSGNFAPTRVVVSPGDATVIEGSELRITIGYEGRKPGRVLIGWKDQSAAEWAVRRFQARETRRWEHVFGGIRGRIDYWAQTDRARSPVYRVTVENRPRVAGIEIRYDYPTYTGMPPRIVGEGDISAPVGTRVTVTATATKPLSRASLVVSDSLEMASDVRAKTAVAAFDVDRSGTYFVRLTDVSGYDNPEPIRYRISATDDAPPRVRLTEPGVDIELGERVAVDLRAEGVDDFGFSRLALRYRLGDAGQETEILIPLAQEPGRLLDQRYPWDLSDLDLLPDDVVHYRILAWDNDTINGPKMASTGIYAIRLPSIYQIFDEVMAEQEAQVEVMEEMSRAAERLEEQLDTVSRELLKTERLEWEERRELEDTLDHLDAMTGELERMAERFTENVDRLAEEGALSLETLDKLLQVRQLLSDVESPQMREARERLREALEALDPQDIERALKDLTLSDEAFAERLDRVISLLEFLKLEQMLDALADQVRGLLERQEALRSRVARGEAPPGAAERQERMAREVEQLKGVLKEAAELAQEHEFSPSEALAALVDSISRGELESAMMEAAGALRSGGVRLAGEAQGRVVGELSQLAAGLDAALEAMRQNLAAEIARALRRGQKDLLRLSHLQEALAERTEEEGRRLNAAPALSVEQSDLLEALGGVEARLAEAARESMVASPAAFLALAKAREKMFDALSVLSAGNGLGAGREQRSAMGAINESVQALRESLSALEAASAQGMSTMEMLGQIAQRQRELNQATLGLFGMNQGEITPELAAQLSRLAAEQESLRRQLEALERARERGGEGALGRLERIMSDMDEIVREFQGRRLTPELLGRQDRILSRLLDAQRSIRQREYSRQRESQTARFQPPKRVGPLRIDTVGADAELRRLLQEALDEGYTHEYRDLIARYFDAIAHDLARTR